MDEQHVATREIWRTNVGEPEMKAAGSERAQATGRERSVACG